MDAQDPRAAVPPSVRPKSQRRFLLLKKRPASSNSQSHSMPSPTFSTRSRPANLSIQASIKFKAPLDFIFEHTYETSPFFDPTEEFCQALVRRVDHGCIELITRKDSAALDDRSGEKALRYEIDLSIHRSGTSWASRSFRSYQKLFLEKHSALDVIEATDRIIGAFLNHHDQNFRWQAREPSSFELDPAMLAVPLHRFLVASQEYESVPGYDISVQFTDRCRARNEAPWEKRISIKSQQSTPLTLALAEELTWNLSRSMNEALDLRKQALDHQHAACDPIQDAGFCGHVDGNSLQVSFKVHNNLGVDVSHLNRIITTKLALFRHPEGLDCQEFTDHLERSISDLRDHADSVLGRLDDLRILVREVSCTHWSVKDPFALSVDSSVCHSRRNVQAILDRVQSGMGDVLRATNTAVSFTAVKRGHIILSKTIAPRNIGRRGSGEPQQQESVLFLLQDRLKSDVSMVIRDTLSLGYTPAIPLSVRTIDGRLPVSPEVIPVPLEVAVAVPMEAEASPPATSASAPSEPNTEALASELDGNPLKVSEPPAMPEGVETYPETVEELDATEATVPDETPKAQISVENPIDRRPSAAAVSFITSDAAESIAASTRPSTPSLSDHDTDTPLGSFVVTPTPQRGLDHFVIPRDFEEDEDAVVVSLGQDSIPMTESARPLKEARKFNLLGRSQRPMTPETTTGASEASIARKPQSSNVDVPEVAPLAGWLEFCVVDDDTVHVQEEGIEVVRPEQPTQGPATPPAEAQTPMTEAIVGEEAGGGKAKLEDLSHYGGWLRSSIRSVEDVANNQHEDKSSINVLDDEDQTVREILPPFGIPASSKNVTGATGNATLPPEPKTPEMKPKPYFIENSPVLAPSLLPNTQPQGSGGSPSSTMLWHQARSPYRLDDGDFFSYVPDSPSRSGRPRTAHSPALLSTPLYRPLTPSYSPTASPTPARRPVRPHLQAHKRQFSSPTAGYFGLLHSGSPLRIQSYYANQWDHLQEIQLPKPGEVAGSREASRERRQPSPARRLLEFGQTKRTSSSDMKGGRPMSAGDIVADANARRRGRSGSEARPRSGSMLGTIIWSS